MLHRLIKLCLYICNPTRFWRYPSNINLPKISLLPHKITPDLLVTIIIIIFIFIFSNSVFRSVLCLCCLVIFYLIWFCYIYIYIFDKKGMPRNLFVTIFLEHDNTSIYPLGVAQEDDIDGESRMWSPKSDGAIV